MLICDYGIILGTRFGLYPKKRAQTSVVIISQQVALLAQGQEAVGKAVNSIDDFMSRALTR